MKSRKNPWLFTAATALALACGDDGSNGASNGAGNGNGTGNGSGNGGGPPGLGEGLATISGDASFEVRGPAEWDRTSTSLTNRGTTYTVWTIAVVGEAEAELSARILQPYDGAPPRVPDDGTFELGSSMTENGLSVTSAEGDFTSFSNGTVTVAKDASLSVWSVAVSATRSGSEALDVAAEFDAIPDRGLVRTTLDGELAPLWGGSASFNELEPGLGIFNLSLEDTVGDSGLDVEIQLGTTMSLYMRAPGTYAPGDGVVDEFRLDTPVGRVEPSSAELVITDFGGETLSGTFVVSAEAEGNQYEISGELVRLRYDSL